MKVITRYALSALLALGLVVGGSVAANGAAGPAASTASSCLLCVAVDG